MAGSDIDFLKRDRPFHLFREVLPAEGESLYPRRFDLLIVDEAHNVAPSGSGQYAIDSQRTATIRLLAQLTQMWDKYADPLMQALEVRRGKRSTSLQRDLQNRAEKEIADITAILTELQKSILKELEEPQVEQLTLFSTPEREQFERNVNSLKARAEQIPREIEQETSLICKRFENPSARLFPLAVTFLIPQKLIRP